MLVGYQGIEGSFSNQAANDFIKKLNIKDAKLIPLVDSESVMKSLVNNEIDFGVCAIRNSTAGSVIETEKALENRNVQCLDTLDLRIIHCLYIRKGMDIHKIKKVASHIQAINQTKNTREKYFPTLEEVEYADTALAAKDLENGILDNEVSVICSKIAGEIFHLELVYEGLNDNPENTTTFGIYVKEK